MTRLVTRLLPFVFMLLVSSLLMCSCVRYSASSSMEASGYEKVYSFPEAGFQARFPGEPVRGEGDGVYSEVETTYAGSSYADLTVVFYADAPEILESFVASGPDEVELRESIEANLLAMASDFILKMDIGGVDPDWMECRNFGTVSPYSGMLTFDGRLDLSEYGGRANQEAGFCCILVCENGKVYSVYEIRETIAEAVEAAESFTLIERVSDGSDAPEAEEGSGVSAGAIPWSEASGHVGETVTLYGPIVDTEWAAGSNGQPAFLDMGAAYPDESRVSVTIWGEDRSNFPEPPEDTYKGLTVAVTGEVYVYDGVCRVEVTSPSQITVL